MRCITGSATQASVEQTQAGQPGLTQTVMGGDGISWSNRYDGGAATLETKLTTTMASPMNPELDSYANRFDGYFKAPASGEYRFLINCDDKCNFLFDQTNTLSSGVTPVLAEMAKVSYRQSFRDYHRDRDSQSYVTDWMSLTEGEYYQMQGY